MTENTQTEGGYVTAPTMTPAEPAKASEATEYVVLRETSSGLWKYVRKDSARTPEAAIKSVYSASDSDASTDKFVAVPARSWKPVKVTAKVETTLVVEAAKS